MRLTPDNFLQLIKNLVTGGGALSVNVSGTTTNQKSSLMPSDGGFLVDVDYPASAFQNSGAASTAVMTTTASTTLLKITAGQTPTLIIPFQIPRDYDQSLDWFSVRVTADKAAAGADAPTLTAKLYSLPLGAATPTQIGPNASEYNITIPTVTLSPSTAIQEFHFGGNGLVRDTQVFVAITPAGNATAGQEVQVYSAQINYASCLVAFTEETLGNDPADLAGNDALGFPLR